jgi:hypothetical protein
MRLVPNQEWEHITELFTKHFKYRSWFSNRKSYSSRRSGYGPHWQHRLQGR